MMPQQKSLAVIILNWNGIELLKQFIPVAAKYTISDHADLIVADNGSSDDSLQWLRENFPEVKIIALEQNYGFAEGYNRAIRRCSQYPFTVLLNSDVEVTPQWWQPMLTFMQQHPEVGAVQPKIRSWRNPKMFEYAGAAGGYIDNLGYPYCRGRIFDKVEEDKGQYDGEPADICWASGACLMVRTDTYLDLGGLDPDFFAHQEEIDLCCRMLAAGFRVCAISDSYVLHVGGASLSMGNPRKTYLNFRNNLLLLHKNLPKKYSERFLFIRRLVDTAALMMFLLKADWGNVKAIWNAHRDFRKMRRKYTNLPKNGTIRQFPGADKSSFLLRLRNNKK